MGTDGEQIRVHYLFWDHQWDEWVPRNSPRLAPHGRQTYLVGGLLRVGQRIDVLDLHPAHTKWIESTVVAEDSERVKVRPPLRGALDPGSRSPPPPTHPNHHHQNHHSRLRALPPPTPTPIRARARGGGSDPLPRLCREV
jgi:hypothetical protein